MTVPNYLPTISPAFNPIAPYSPPPYAPSGLEFLLTNDPKQIWVTYDEHGYYIKIKGVFISELEALRHAVNNQLKIKSFPPGEIDFEGREQSD